MELFIVIAVLGPFLYRLVPAGVQWVFTVRHVDLYAEFESNELPDLRVAIDARGEWHRVLPWVRHDFGVHLSRVDPDLGEVMANGARLSGPGVLGHHHWTASVMRAQIAEGMLSLFGDDVEELVRRRHAESVEALIQSLDEGRRTGELRAEQIARWRDARMVSRGRFGGSNTESIFWPAHVIPPLIALVALVACVLYVRKWSKLLPSWRKPHYKEWKNIRRARGIRARR